MKVLTRNYVQLLNETATELCHPHLALAKGQVSLQAVAVLQAAVKNIPEVQILSQVLKGEVEYYPLHLTVLFGNWFWFLL